MVVKRFLLVAAMVGLAAGAAAQTPPAQPSPPPIAVPFDLAQQLGNYLHFGGSRAEADMLLARLSEIASAPEREKAVQARIDAAVAAARREAPPPRENPTIVPGAPRSSSP